MCDGQLGVRVRQVSVECKIDKLSDELLVAILSYLSVMEAAKTCLVCRRWRYLWQYTYGCLEIYDKDNTTAQFIKLVNDVLELHQGPTLDKFRVGFCYYSCWFTFDHWVKFAIQKEVKFFELNLAVDSGGRSAGWMQYDFPDIGRLSDNIGKQKLSRFCCNLKSLTLVNVNVKEEIIQFFLSNCPCLEQVCVSGSKGLHNLKVSGPSLKSMEISWSFNIKCLEVNDAYNLESFTYIGPDMKLVPNFHNAPQFSELTIGGEYCCSFFLKADKHTSYSSKLRKLKLTVPPEAMFRSWYTFTYPDNFPRLDNLKELELDLMLKAGESLIFFTYFTKASPLLSTFTARITYTDVLAEELIDRPEATHFVHKHLKVVKLYGFTGCISDFNLALHLLEIGGQSLKKIILQPTNDRHHHDVSRMAAALIEKQSKQLENKLPPGVELVML